MITSTVFTLIKYGVTSGAVSPSDIFKSETTIQCRLSGNLCSISCPQFKIALSNLDTSKEATEISCIYRKVKHTHLTLGQLYFINRTIITKQTEDRDFLYRTIVGKPLFEDSSAIIYEPLKTVGASLKELNDDFIYTPRKLIAKESNTENIGGVEETLLASIRDEVTIILKKTFEQKINQSRDALVEKLKSSRPTDYVKHVLKNLQEGVKGPQHFGMYEYITIILDYIQNSPKNKYKQYEIISFVKYMILAFIPKDMNDFPAIAMSSHQINELIIKTKDLSDDHPYKWTAKRKNQADHQKSRYRKMVYVNDFLYLWKLYIVNTTPIQELTESDIRLKFIVDMLIYRLSFEYSTERIILNKMDDVCLKRLKKVLQTMMVLVREHHMLGFSIFNISDIWLEPQISNQYMLKISVPRSVIESNACPSNKRRPSPSETFSYLLENNDIEAITLLES